MKEVFELPIDVSKLPRIPLEDFKLTASGAVSDFKWVMTDHGVLCLKCNKEITENIDERCEYCKEWKVE